jgi:SAM-dependent methyltransferase
MTKKVDRPDVRAGYDRWSETYDYTPNPLVALDRRYTMDILRPHPGELILDAGCGTGANLRRLVQSRSNPAGIDFSRGMLNVARRTLRSIPLAQADLNESLPLHSEVFDAVLCALVGEHLSSPSRFFREASAALLPGGRFVFSVFHPQMAVAGIEANFEREGVEYRLGAHRHSVHDYLTAIEDVGFERLRAYEFEGNDDLVSEVPWATKYVGTPLLLAVEARRAV